MGKTIMGFCDLRMNRMSLTKLTLHNTDVVDALILPSEACMGWVKAAS
jgi:hypothetical protein